MGELGEALRNRSLQSMIALGTARKSKSFGDGLENADQPYGPTEPQNDTCLLKDFIQLNSFHHYQAFTKI
jgi:hypothetical protein